MTRARAVDGGAVRAAGVGFALVSALAFGLAFGLAGCAPEPADARLPPEVRAELLQYRSDVAARQVVVEITNGTGSALEIGEVTVSDARFVEPAERVVDRASTVAPGVTVAIRVQLPDVACFGGPTGGADAAPPPSATVHWRQGEVSGVSDLALTDPLDVLGPLHERECRGQALADAAAVSFADFAPSAPGEPAVLTLAVTPTGRAEAQLQSIRPTNLLMIGTDAVSDPLAYPLRLQIDRASAPVQIDLPLLPFRCDAHAVQEDKRGTIFSLEVLTPEGAGQIEVAASPDMRADILSWVARWCGFGS